MLHPPPEMLGDKEVAGLLRCTPGVYPLGRNVV